MRSLTRFESTLRRNTLAAAALALCAASALASNDVASLAYAGGEALPPEAEARLVALTTTPGGAMSRDEVRQQLADARREGSLAEAGEMADRPAVLTARLNANERQTREILAARAVEEQRLAALEAAAEVRRQAEALARSPGKADDTTAMAATGSVPAGSPDAVTTDAGTPTEVPAELPDSNAALPPASPTADAPAEAPTDAPSRMPELPLLAPSEVPVARPADLPDEVLLDDKD